MSEEYIFEDDYPLTESINHYAKLSNNEDYKYKFIEIMQRIASEEVVYIADLKLLEKEFKCPIRAQLTKGSGCYLGVEISKLSELNRFLGRRIGKYKDCKLGFNRLRNAINATW
nr:hypothetical protein [uncultured Bacteroides sp.]